MLAQRFVGDIDSPFPPSALDRCGRRIVIEGEKGRLDRAGAVLLQAIRDDLGPVVAEELLGTVQHGNQTDDALLRLDAAAFPGVEMNAERLGESPGHVERQRQALLFLLAGRCFVFVIIVRLGVYVFVVRGRDWFSVLRGCLKRPEEESGQPGVFFEGPSGPVSGFRFRRTQYLLECRPTNDFPHIRQEAPLMWLSRFGIAAKGISRSSASTTFE